MRMTMVELRQWQYDGAKKLLSGIVESDEQKLLEKGDELMALNVSWAEERREEMIFLSHTDKYYLCRKAEEKKETG